MPQSRLMSLVEAVALATSPPAFDTFGLAATLGQNLAIGAIFTMISLARSYVLRRALRRSEGDPPQRPWASC